MNIPQQNILSLIPQRPPFVMVDQLLACSEKSFKTIFTIAKENVLVNKGELSEAGLLENIAQTAAAGVGYKAKENDTPVLTGYIGAIKNFDVFALPKIGDVITTEVVIEQHIFDVTLISGYVTRNGKLLASCEMKIFINTDLTS